MTAWLRPTARSIVWAPLAGVSACLVVVTVWAERWPEHLVGIAAACVAAAVVAGLADPAAALLAALPTSATVRRVRRLLLLVPTGLAVWLLTAHGPVLGLLALTALGIAVSLRAGVPLGVAVPLAWVVLAWAAGFDWELR